MPLFIKARFDLSGWYAKNERLLAAIKTMKVWELYPSGEAGAYSSGEPSGMDKAIWSFQRGDTPYHVRPEVMKEGSALVAKQLKKIAQNRHDTTLEPAMERFGKLALVDAKGHVLAGYVEGPQRSAAWIAKKGQDINMNGMTTDGNKFVFSLKSRLIAQPTRRAA